MVFNRSPLSEHFDSFEILGVIDSSVVNMKVRLPSQNFVFWVDWLHSETAPHATCLNDSDHSDKYEGILIVIFICIALKSSNLRHGITFSFLLNCVLTIYQLKLPAECGPALEISCDCLT